MSSTSSDTSSVSSENEPYDPVEAKRSWPQRIKRRARIIWKNITVEPVIFFIMFSQGIDTVSLNQLKIEKSCKIDFKFNETVCDNLLEENYTEQNKLVQDEVDHCTFILEALHFNST